MPGDDATLLLIGRLGVDGIEVGEHLTILEPLKVVVGSAGQQLAAGEVEARGGDVEPFEEAAFE